MIASNVAGPGDLKTIEVAVFLRTIAGAAGDIDRACFFYVQAYVFALETGHRDEEPVRALLRRHGREE